MIKILHIVSSLGGGGVEHMLYNYYKNLDRSSVKFDFITHGKKVGMLEKKLIGMNSNIYHVTPKKESVIKNFFEIKEIIKKGNYNIVEVHQNFSSFPALFAACIHGVKTRIIHAHGCVKNERQSLALKTYRFLNKVFATDFAACSNDARSWLYGEDFNKEVQIVNNAIDDKKFKYDKDTREEFRKKLGLKGDDVCLLQVGRFSYEKNHIFTLNILEKLQEKKYKLFFAGEGGIEQKIRTLVSNAGLGERVEFLGCVDYIPELMNAADVLLFPSLHEGLPLVVIEAQLSGLKVLASDTLTTEMNISGNIDYISINNADEWAEKISSLKLDYSRENVSHDAYSIEVQVKGYFDYLKSLLEKNK